jgi:hypothetical protein
LTAQSMARWMIDEFERGEILRHDEVVSRIAQRFGSDFVHFSPYGNGIRRDVVRAFRYPALDVVWIPRGRYWRKRRMTDHYGRKQF